MEGKEDEQGGAQGRPRARGMPARAAEGGGTRRRVSRMARSPLNGGCSLFTWRKCPGEGELGSADEDFLLIGGGEMKVLAGLCQHIFPKLHLGKINFMSFRLTHSWCHSICSGPRAAFSQLLLPSSERKKSPRMKTNTVQCVSPLLPPLRVSAFLLPLKSTTTKNSSSRKRASKCVF